MCWEKMLSQNFVERLRPLVGVESWDYIVLWKLTDDHRHLELVDCMCAGTQNILKNGEELVLPASSSGPCRDVLYPHVRITACELLDHIPSSVTLDSGIHADALLSNQSCWLNFSYNSDMNPSEETIGTRVLVPVPIGLLELFVTKQVPEDQVLNDFIKTQCNIFLERQPITDQGCIHPSDSNLQHEPNISTEPSNQNSDLLLPHDISVDRIHLNNNSPTDSFQQFGSVSDFMNKSNGVFVGGTYLLDPFASSCENTFHEMEASQHNINEKASFTEENNKSDDSDLNDEDENDGKYRKRNGKGQSKNLEAERKRRKKLNDRLYKLRALVPNISKLDRSAILGDAIDYVKELQKQVKELKLELEEHSDDENNPATRNDMPCQNGTKNGAKREHENFSSGFHKGSSSNSGVSTFKHASETESLDGKVQQMEPQVEVYQLDGNEFYVKVFCEHKTGGFVRLMEALDYLGLEISNVNVTRHTCLVSNVFKVEIKESENVHADYVKESLLELTRNPLRAWPNIPLESSFDNIQLPHHY